MKKPPVITANGALDLAYLDTLSGDERAAAKAALKAEQLKEKGRQKAAQKAKRPLSKGFGLLQHSEPPQKKASKAPTVKRSRPSIEKTVQSQLKRAAKAANGKPRKPLIKTSKSEQKSTFTRIEQVKRQVSDAYAKWVAKQAGDDE